MNPSTFTRRRVLLVGGVFFLALMAFLAAAVFAFRQWQDTQQRAQIALARQLAAQAQSLALVEEAPSETALLLAIQSLRLHPSGEAAQVVQSFLPHRRLSQSSCRGYVRALDISADGRFAVAAHESETVCVWNILTGEHILISEKAVSPILAAAINADGRYIAWGSNDPGWRKAHLVQVWDTASGRELSSVQYEWGVNAVDILPDGEWAADAGADAFVHVFDVFTGEQIASFPHDAKMANVVSLSSDGRYVAAGTRDTYAIFVWEIASGERIARLRQDGYVTAVAFSPDARLIAAGGDQQDPSVRIWEIATGEEIVRLYHEKGIGSLAFSPDGQYLVSVEGGRVVRVWEVGTGQEISGWTDGGSDGIRFASFSPDGDSILTGSFRGEIYRWDWKPEDLVAEACGRVSRNLDRETWRQYVGDALPYGPVCPDLPLEPVPTPVTIIPPTPYQTVSP
jgi:WD40 repeat protein